MRRKDREMPPEFALTVADKCEYAVISMTDISGEPYCVPVTIARDGNAVYFAKDTETKKAVLASDKKHLLLDHVKDFTCEKKEDKEKKQKDILHISLQLKNEDMAEFTCDKEVVMRNQ